MKPKKALRTSLTATLFFAFVLVPSASGEAVSNVQIAAAVTQVQLTVEKPNLANSPNDYTSTEGTNKENKSRTPEKVKKDKKHADEEKHKNHLYHYNRVKRKKKSHTSILCSSLKIFIAICYIAVLLCGYMSIVH